MNTPISTKEINDYLEAMHSNITSLEKVSIELTLEWSKKAPNEPGVYIVFEEENIMYVGETGLLRGRMKDIRDSRNHTLRRKIGEALFSNSSNYQKGTCKKKHDDETEIRINQHMESDLKIVYMVVWLGRKELESYLIEKYHPKYNSRKERNGKQKRD